VAAVLALGCAEPGPGSGGALPEIPDGALACPAVAADGGGTPPLAPGARADAGVDGGSEPLDARPTALEGRKVVIVSIDGLRPDAIFRAPAPNLQRLACRGSYSFRARTILPSLTLPSHASMVSGFPPEVHGLEWNELQPGYIRTPTIFSVARAAGRRVVLVVGKDKLVQLAPPGSVDVFVWATDGDGDVAARAVAEIERGFDLLFVHFPDVDLTGHQTGWLSGPYLRQLAATDAALGRVIAALPADAIVIATADHGGHGYGHGAGAPVDVTIPWLIAGPDIRAGHALTVPVSTLDTAATAARLVGVELRGDVIGRPIREAFVAP
jgi:hypothetical protein